MAPIPSRDVEALVTEFPTASQEKQLPRQSTEAEPKQNRQLSAGRKMLLALLVCFLVTFGISSANSLNPESRTPCHGEKSNGNDRPAVVDVEHSAFSSVLGSAAPESLGDILLKYFPGKYKLGVWPSEQSALEAIQRENVDLAGSVSQMAKRQDNSTTTGDATVTETATQSATELPASTTVVSQVVTTVVTATDNGKTVTQTQTVENTQTTVVTPATTAAATSPPQTTASATKTTPTTSATSASETTASSASKTSAGTTLTTSKSSTSAAADGSSTSSQSLRKVTSTYTSTLPGGEVSVVTATSVIDADPVQTDGSSTSTKPQGSLQTNNAAVLQQRGALVVGVVMGGALLL